MGKKSGSAGKRSGSAKGGSLATSRLSRGNRLPDSLGRPALSALAGAASPSPPKPAYRDAGAVRRLVTAQRMAVARAEHDRRVAAGFLAAPSNVKPRVSRLNISTGLQAAKALTREPVQKTVDHKKSRDLFKCKERPDPKKSRPRVGSGFGTKRFVPWCG